MLLSNDLRPMRASRIAILLHSLESGGAQLRIVTLANAFARMGRQVDLLALDTRGPMAAALDPQIRVLSLGQMSAASPEMHAPCDRLATYLAEQAPQILLSGATNSHAIAARAHRVAGRPGKLILRASRHPDRLIPWSAPAKKLYETARRRIETGLYRSADAIVAVSGDVAEGLRRLVRKPIETILNPVVTAELLDRAAAPTPHPWAESKVPLILGVGRLVLQKDFETLLHAFRLVRHQRAARLVLLGDGPERARLERLAQALELTDHVLFAGHCGSVAGWMRGAALTVSSSLWEGCSAVPIEAMALGCPVVATDCPGSSRETLGGGRYGPLVPIRAPVTMAQAMLATLDAPPAPALLCEGASLYAEAGKAEAYLDLFDACVGEAAMDEVRDARIVTPGWAMAKAA